jgi:hypothetical protein
MPITNLQGHLTAKRTEAFWARIDKRGPEECWPWKVHTQLTQGGYGAAFYGPVHTVAHRIAWMLTYGSIRGDELLLHSCDNRRCCNPAHLSYGSPQANMDDMRAKGREYFPGPPSGEQNGNAKLADKDVRRIKALAVGLRLSQRELAEIYGVSKSQIGNILRGESRR